MKNLTIGIYDSGLPFSGAMDIAKESLGGSETAAYYMAKHLAALGHDVQVCCHCPEPGKYHGVKYHNQDQWPALAGSADFDIVIVNRAVNMFGMRLKSRMNIIWAHDMPPQDSNQFLRFLWGVDRMFVMSDFQAESYRTCNPAFPPEALDRILWKTRNGIDTKLIAESIKGIKKNPKQFIYTSRPERGLQELLQDIWPTLVAKDPELQLGVCTYNVPTENLPTEIVEFFKWMNQLIKKTPNVIELGPLNKTQLYKAIAASQGVLYPSHFPEIYCISAVEAMACGTPMITTNGFALPETCGDAAILIDGKPYERAFQSSFIEATEKLLDASSFEYKSLQKRGFERAAALDWASVATSWDAYFDEFFQERFKNNKKRICQQLIYNSDLVVANRLAKEESLQEEEALTNTFLENLEKDPERYYRTDMDVAAEEGWEKSVRFATVASHIPEDAKSLLDVGCGLGLLLIHVHQKRQDMELIGVDFSETLINKAREFSVKHCALPGQIRFFNKRIQDFEGEFDVVVCAETLEHIIDTESMVAQLERLCRPGGTIILTLPSGPWESMSFHEVAKAHTREHVHSFERTELMNLFSHKQGFNHDLIFAGTSARGELLGNWVVYWRNNPKKETLGKLDYDHKIKTTRPYNKLSVEMIVKDEEDHISRCIKSILPQCDELIIYDSGSTDWTEQIVKHVVGERYLPAMKYIKGDWPHSFAEARNKALAEATGDWHMWIDADEILVYGQHLHKYLDSVAYPGYVIKQNHLILDLHAEPDCPTRVFRADMGIQFFGDIHEAPEVKLNENVEPVLTLSDVEIAHYGYLTNAVRTEKCYARNMPLLLKDRVRNPDRILGLPLLARDYVNLAERGAAINGNEFTEQGINFLREVVNIYLKVFAPMEYIPRKKRYWEFCFAFYQSALRHLGRAGLNAFREAESDEPPFEVALGLVAGLGGVSRDTTRVPMERRWFSSKEEFSEWMVKESETTLEQIRPVRFIR